MPTKRLSADVVTAKAFVLVDDSNRERCVIEMSPTGESGMVLLNLLDSRGRPRIALQVDPDGNPSIWPPAINLQHLTLTLEPVM